MTVLVRSDLACHAADVRPATLRAWVARGHISPPHNGYYNLTEILAWTDRRSHRHALAARFQRHTQRDSRCTTRRNV